MCTTEKCKFTYRYIYNKLVIAVGRVNLLKTAFGCGFLTGLEKLQLLIVFFYS